MTYRCGTNGLQTLGITDADPRYTCDQCGRVQSCITTNGHIYRWKMDGKQPPGWQRIGDKDFCKKCKGEK